MLMVHGSRFFSLLFFLGSVHMPATRGVLLTTQLDVVKPLKENCLKWMLITTPLLEYLDWIGWLFGSELLFLPCGKRDFCSLGTTPVGVFFWDVCIQRLESWILFLQKGLLEGICWISRFKSTHKTGWWFQILFFNVQPYLGKWSSLSLRIFFNWVGSTTNCW